MELKEHAAAQDQGGQRPAFAQPGGARCHYGERPQPRHPASNRERGQAARLDEAGAATDPSLGEPETRPESRDDQMSGSPAG